MSNQYLLQQKPGIIGDHRYRTLIWPRKYESFWLDIPYCSSLYWSLLRRKAVALTARVEGPYLWAKLAKHLGADKNIILCHFPLVAITELLFNLQ
jgi:hypothetical protein